ncbi:MAG: hypothetical protein ACOY31_09530 [Bacillota bacterium]
MTTGYLHTQDEIGKACDIIESFLGQHFFKKGIEELKDNDPSGSGMGRQSFPPGSSRLVMLWNRAREELAFGELGGCFTPGISSAIMGALGKYLETLASAPKIKEAAMGLMENHSFDSTLFTLSIAFGFSLLSRKPSFSSAPGCSFTVADSYIAGCLCPAATTPLRDIPLKAAEFAGRLAGENIPGPGLEHILYIDLSYCGEPLEIIRDMLADTPPENFSVPGLETAAVIPCKISFNRITGGVIMNTSGLPVFLDNAAENAYRSGEIYIP